MGIYADTTSAKIIRTAIIAAVAMLAVLTMYFLGIGVETA